MIFGGAMKGMAQPHSRRVGIATVMNLSNPPVSMFFLFFFEETLDSNKHLGPCNQFIFCFSLTTTTHHLSSQISSELILSPLDWDLCIFLDTKKTRTEKCVYPMSHFSPDLDIQFFKHLEQVEGLWKQKHSLVKNVCPLARKAFTCAKAMTLITPSHHRMIVKEPLGEQPAKKKSNGSLKTRWCPIFGTHFWIGESSISIPFWQSTHGYHGDLAKKIAARHWTSWCLLAGSHLVGLVPKVYVLWSIPNRYVGLYRKTRFFKMVILNSDSWFTTVV